MNRYAHVARAVLSRPWAIRKDSVEWAAVIEVLERRVSGNEFSDDELQARLATAAQRRAAVPVSDQDERVISVIPVHGVLMPRANLMSEYSGGTSVAQLSAAFGEAVNDDRVAAIVFDVDSPGGLVDGIPEFGEQIRAARGSKPITAVADTMAASAAYWIASQAEDFSVTPSGEVGSIGVFSAHDDMSKFYAEMGLERTFITYGQNKAQGNEFEPLSDHARERMQATVDYFGRMFDEAVAAGRGVKPSVVREKFGQGDMFPAEEALELGMVDRIETLTDAIRRVAAGPGGSRRDRSALEQIGGKQLLAEVPDVAIADEEQADPAVAAATEEGPDLRAELEELKTLIALRPARRRQTSRTS